tara:strand:+ start:71 stop:430 length:360 start_codon:yes stop_codon:yes gene_type:complete
MKKLLIALMACCFLVFLVGYFLFVTWPNYKPKGIPIPKGTPTSVKVNTSDEWITGVFWHKQTQKKLIVTDKDGKKISYPMEKVQGVKLNEEYINNKIHGKTLERIENQKLINKERSATP